jgi:hypothetical protein
MFRTAMEGRGKVQPYKLLDLEPLESTEATERSDKGSPTDAVATIFQSIGSDRMRAARQTLTYAAGKDAVETFVDAARLLVYFKGRDSHDYKFSSAVLEDYQALSPKWRDRYLAATVFNLPGTAMKDNPLVMRTREALMK